MHVLPFCTFCTFCRPARLAILHVEGVPVLRRTFQEIALAEGNKSQEVKKRLITKLLVSSSGNEPGYIMRALQVQIDNPP